MLVVEALFVLASLSALFSFKFFFSDFKQYDEVVEWTSVSTELSFNDNLWLALFKLIDSQPTVLIVHFLFAHSTSQFEKNSKPDLPGPNPRCILTSKVQQADKENDVASKERFS
jgi:hypothetical protein